METREKYILHNQDRDGLDRRGFLECMAWAGTGMLWTVSGGLLGSSVLASKAGAAEMSKGTFSFVQISDSHIGFNKEGVNTDVVAALQEAISCINALPEPPDFVLHTGDLTYLAEADEFDTLEQLLKSVKTQQIFYVPGEHDLTGDNGKLYLERFGKNTKGHGWHSFDHNGVHFVGLVNVMDIQQNGLGSLGVEQLEWLEDDLRGRSGDTPVVVGVSAMGLGDGRRRDGAGIFEAVWIGYGVEWTHSSNDEKGGGPRDVSHGNVHGISAARAGQGAETRADEGRCREVAQLPRRDGCELHRGWEFAGDCGLDAGLSRGARWSSGYFTQARLRHWPRPVARRMAWRPGRPHRRLNW
jgi:Calcineurin-like phosphoesterase